MLVVKSDIETPANQINITDFCKGTLILILFANHLTYFKIIHLVGLSTETIGVS